MDDELAELVPVFVAEARERLGRLAELAPLLAADAGAAGEVKRELHTLKGAGRMMGLAPFGELCHAAEEALGAGPPGLEALLLAVHDALAAAVDAVEEGRAPEPAEALAAELRAAAGAGSAPSAPAAAPAPAEGAPRPASPASAPAPLAGLEAGLDGFAERAVRVRAAAGAAGRLVERLDELARLTEEGLRDPQPAQALGVVIASLRHAAAEAGALAARLERAGEEQLELVLALQLAPLRPLLQSLARHARELARALGRELEVEIAGADTRLDRRLARELEGALRHLVANAVDHGVEPPGERLAAGKPAVARLLLAARAGGRGVEIEIADDGRGIDGERLAARAAAAGLLSEAAAAALDGEAALRLALLPGLSTRDEATSLSGRGVGLDAVAAAVGRQGGEVRLAAEPGRGTRIVLDLPAGRRGERVLLVRAAGRRLAVPAVAVRRVSSLAAARVEARDGHRVALFADRIVPFVPLAALFGRDEGALDLLVEGAVGGRELAFAVERIEGEEEVLVRRLPRRARASPRIDGAALLPSGDPVPVVAPAALLARDLAAARPAPAAAPAPGAAAKRLLLVDDSRVTREMERRILEDAGFHVEVAGDGDEAMRRLAAEPFDCLVTDIEMPGLDGFQLTEELRRAERFARLPIVVVSTRERPEDRLRGLRAGADAYLTKQSLVVGDLVETLRRLTGG
ncbi:MAG: response regulator [Thermoanaerobaculia bacterium]|nr:response regulator [Thermoanaerobaculia bacterium]